jgi:hypothetical protein
MQRMHFRAKSAKNDLKPTAFLNRNFYFETEGVYGKMALASIFYTIVLRCMIKL